MPYETSLQASIDHLKSIEIDNPIDAEAICNRNANLVTDRLGQIMSLSSELRIHYIMSRDGSCEQWETCTRPGLKDFGNFVGFTSTHSALEPHIENVQNELCVVLQRPLQDDTFTLYPVKAVEDPKIVIDELYDDENAQELLGILSDEEPDLRSLVHVVSNIDSVDKLHDMSALCGSLRMPSDFCSYIQISGSESMDYIYNHLRFRVGRIGVDPCLAIIHVDKWGCDDSRLPASGLTHNEQPFGVARSYGLSSFIRPASR